MKVDMNIIRKCIPIALAEKDTGHVWLDRRYAECLEPYYKLFYWIAQEMKPAISVELGTDRATASAHMALGYPEGQVITVDTHISKKLEQDKTREALAVCSNLVYIHGSTIAEETHRHIIDYPPIDLLFIDSKHHYDHASKEWALYRNLLADEALVVFDDIFDSPPDCVDMVRLWHEAIAPGYEHFLDAQVHRGPPMGFLRYVAS